jgi:hypothetical protein
MAAVTTKKATGDAGVQLTFPLNFQRAYSAPYAYFPSYSGSPMEIMVGQDFQSQYHQEKRIEANKRVFDGIQANRTKERLLLTGPHNYHLPKPVLGQRIYANPMNGAEMPSSTRRDNGKLAPFKVVEVGAEGGMRGGVVHTLEGQEFYKKQLDRRISQLNRMNALAQGFATQLGQEYKTDDNTKTGSIDKVQFFTYLRALMDAVVVGDLSRFTFENLKEMIDMLFKFGPTMTDEDFKDTLDALVTLIVTIRSGLSENPEYAQFDDEKRAYAQTLEVYVERMRTYVDTMFVKQTLSEKDKRTLSKSLKKSLGFEGLIRKERLVDVLYELRRQNPRVDQNAEDNDDGDDDGRFDRPATPREDGEQRGMPRAPYAGRNGDDNQERFGRTTGFFVYGGPTWFGENDEARADEREDVAPRYVAPLTLSGADPNAERVPRANPKLTREALEEVVFSVLSPLGYTRDQDESEFVANNYPSPDDFVAEVSRGMEERGFSKAQIAEAMTEIGMEVFTDYISENAGETAPEPSRAARSSGLMPMGGLAPPIYRDDDEDGNADIAPAEDVGEDGTNARAATTAARPSFTKLVRDHDLPKTRNEMYEKYRTEAQYKALGLRIPKEMGGPYRMREGTTLKNAKAYIIKLFRTIDPSW